MLLVVSRQAVGSGRRKWSVLVLSALAPAALIFGGGGDADQSADAASSALLATQATVGGEDDAPRGIEVVPTPAAVPDGSRTIVEASAVVSPTSQLSAASRWRVVSRTLPAGPAPEQGLQVRTILAARSVSAAFPEISQIGGVRPDALRWHPDGLAVDVMIPNPNSEAGIALGDAIVAYVLKNAERFAMQDAIWRGVYYTPAGQRSGAYGHYDHVHITTKGGGYPSGNELYLR
ncbi:MAG: hypothetical protein K0U78_12455 [Actinomycetia bacterium]|nr:hypothetical protein [Actinomycetes bacterium]